MSAHGPAPPPLREGTFSGPRGPRPSPTGRRAKDAATRCGRRRCALLGTCGRLGLLRPESECPSALGAPGSLSPREGTLLGGEGGQFLARPSPPAALSGRLRGWGDASSLCLRGGRAGLAGPRRGGGTLGREVVWASGRRRPLSAAQRSAGGGLEARPAGAAEHRARQRPRGQGRARGEQLRLDARTGLLKGGRHSRTVQRRSQQPGRYCGRDPRPACAREAS